MSNRFEILGRGRDGSPITNIIRSIIIRANAEFIDKRSKGGALWIVDDERVTKELLEECAYEANCRFFFCKNGSRSTDHRPAWFTKARA